MKFDLRYKLLIPTLAIWGLLYILFNYYLIPVLLENEKQSYIEQQKNQIHFLVEGVVQSIELSDFAHVYASFAHALYHRPEWIELTLWDAGNNLIYPLELPLENKTESLLRISYLHDDPNEGLFTVNLLANPSALKQEQKIIIQQFNIIFLFLFVVVIGTSFFVQQRIIVTPIKRLTEAMEKLSRQNFDIELPAQTNDEIGNLIRSFIAMRFDLKNHQEQLRLAKQKVEESLSVKTRFIATISHELKTPLNIIMGHCQLMELDVRNDKKVDLEDIHSAMQSSRHLNTLIEEILTMSKIDTDRAVLKLQDFSLSELINEITTDLVPFIEKNKNKFETNFYNDINNIRGDKTKIKQILYNLINNANKFTLNGKIIITTRLCQENETSYVRVSIKDTGIGIAKDNQEKIFQPFVQIDSALSRQYEGTGLGLAICNDLCKLMKGHMELESELNQGSTFTICLPVFWKPD